MGSLGWPMGSLGVRGHWIHRGRKPVHCGQLDSGACSSGTSAASAASAAPVDSAEENNRRP